MKKEDSNCFQIFAISMKCFDFNVTSTEEPEEALIQNTSTFVWSRLSLITVALLGYLPKVCVALTIRQWRDHLPDAQARQPALAGQPAAAQSRRIGHGIDSVNHAFRRHASPVRRG